MKKTKWKKRLITFLLAVAVIVVLAEFEKRIKSKAPECTDGTCPVPHGHGLHIDPFPKEFVPQGIKTNQTTEGAENE